VVWLALVYGNGYDPQAIVRIIGYSGPVEGDYDWTLTVVRMPTLFTPAFVAALAAGVGVLVKQRHPLALILLVAVLVLGKLTLTGVPKWLITAVPALIACAAVGASLWWRWLPARVVFIAAAVVPWVVGVRMTSAGAAWGPGFELQRYEAVPQTTSWPVFRLDAGTAVPTPEGPRPLFGHAWVLGGQWKRFVSDFWTEQLEAVETAVRLNHPVLLHERSHGWAVDAYLQLGFTGTDSAFRVVDDVYDRQWTRADGASSRMLQFVAPEDLFDPVATRELANRAGPRVVLIAFPRTLIRLHRVAPGSLQALGPVTAVLDLARLAASLDVQNNGPAHPVEDTAPGGARLRNPR
jgi:hypothetical protein